MNQKLKMTMSVILGFSTSIRKLTGNVSFFDYNNLKISLKITFFVCVCVFVVKQRINHFTPYAFSLKKNLYLCVRL